MPIRDDKIGSAASISDKKPNEKANTQTNKKNTKKSGENIGKNTTYNVSGVIQTLTSGQDNPVNKLTSDLVGATFTITNPHTRISSKYQSTRYTKPETYSTRISNVKNEISFEVEEPYYVTDTTTNKKIPVSLLDADVSITYDTFKTITENTVFKRSYANMTIGNLRTFSGDVYKAKIYTREHGTSTDYEEIYENYVIPENQLVDTTSITGYDNIGFFHTSAVVSSSWVSSSTATQTSPFVTLNNEKLIDGLEISGSVTGLNEIVEFSTKNHNTLEKGVDYVVRFNTYYFKSISERKDNNNNVSNENYASLKVYLSGSTISGVDEDDFFLGEVDIPDSAADEGEIQNVVAQFTSANTGSPRTHLKFELHSGKFIIQDVSIEPFSEVNFNPSFFNVLTPMPKPVRRGDKNDFLVEFYDSNNNLAEVSAESIGTTFQGPPLVIDGTDNSITGSVLVGESVEIYGTNPAYIRSVGYNGFDKTRAKTGDRDGGFLIWSGSIGDGAVEGNRLESSEAYNGVGLEIVDASDDNSANHRFLQFASNHRNTGNSKFRVKTDEFFFGVSGSTTNNYISGSNGKLEISSSNFELNGNTGNVILQGTITAEAGGTIGGFTVSSSALAGENIFISGSPLQGGTDNSKNMFISTSKFNVKENGDITGSAVLFDGGKIGGFNIDDISIASSNSNLILSSSGQITASNAKITGNITATSGEIGGLTIRANNLNSDGDEFQVTGSTGVISGSNVHFDGGKIGGFEIVGNASNVADAIHSTDKSLILSGSGQITGSNFLFDGGKIGGFEVVGNASNVADAIHSLDKSLILSGSGQITASNAKITGNITATSGEIGGLTIKANNLNSDGDEFQVTGSTGVISGSNVHFDGGKIGGFLISEDTIESTDFASGFRGLRLKTTPIASLEVQEATIRGTLKTTVFEKETINAVGGQLHIANSTVITGSEQVGASDTLIQVANSSGFTAGEFILAKKFNSSGFTTEIMKITGVSHNDAGHATNRSGSLTVLRAQGTSDPGTNSPQGVPDEAVLLGVTGGTGASAQTYDPGQVLVSTGKQDTGYIRLNANPNDTTTPYIDIIERNGTGVYDMDLKARLGDLSGLSSGLVGSSPGFGLFSENVFLTGKISATSGQIGGFAINADSISSTDIFISGSPAAGGTDDPENKFISTTNFNVKQNGDITGSAVLFTGGKIGGFTIDADEIKAGSTLVLDSDTNSGQIKLGGASNLTTGDGIYMDGTGDFRVGDVNGARIEFNNSALFLSSSNFILGTSGSGASAYVSSSNNNLRISSSGFDLNSVGNIGTLNLANGKLTFNGSTLTIDGTVNIGSTAASTVESKANAAQSATDVNSADKDGGSVGGWSITSNEIKSNNNKIILHNNNSVDGQIKVGDASNLTTGDGVYMDGTGDFRVGDADGSRIEFDKSAKTLFMSSSKFFLGSGEASISGSNGNLAVSSSTFSLKALDGDNRGIVVDSNIPSLLIQSQSNGATHGEVRITANPQGNVANQKAASIIVSQSQIPIFSVGGDDFGFTSKFNAIMGSAPIQEEEQVSENVVFGGESIPPFAEQTFENSSDTNTNTAGGGAPTVKASNLVVGSSLSASRFSVGSNIFLKNTRPSSSHDTKFHVLINDPESTGSAEPPVNINFDVRKAYADGDVKNSDHIRQSVGFSTILSSADADTRFIKNGETTGSAIYHYFTRLEETANNKWADGKFAMMRLDVDTADLQQVEHRKEFVFLEMRESTGSAANTANDTNGRPNKRVFQVQASGSVVAAGNITAFGTTFMNVSDERLKENIYDVSGSLNKILDLRPTHFTWKENQKQDVGFIAQEVEEIIPEVVETSQGFIDTDGEEKNGIQDMKTISYPKLVPYLVDTIQELTERIKHLEKKVK